jgi:predicted nucleic acid-binding protein
MPALVDTNVLVYRFDHRFPDKQRAATALLRDGIERGDLWVSHQTLVEFVAAATRAHSSGRPLLDLAAATQEVEELMLQFDVLYPNEHIVRLALRGAATYRLPWFDAHIWAYAEHHGLDKLYSEDFQHERRYGTVTVLDPFADL